jgi:hypothetical protein
VRTTFSSAEIRVTTSLQSPSTVWRNSFTVGHPGLLLIAEPAKIRMKRQRAYRARRSNVRRSCPSRSSNPSPCSKPRCRQSHPDPARAIPPISEMIGARPASSMLLSCRQLCLPDQTKPILGFVCPLICLLFVCSFLTLRRVRQTVTFPHRREGRDLRPAWSPRKCRRRAASSSADSEKSKSRSASPLAISSKALGLILQEPDELAGCLQEELIIAGPSTTTASLNV